MSIVPHLNKRKTNFWKPLRRGVLVGKKITFAATDEVNSSGDLVAEFMLSIFELGPGDYAVSDESDILDFMPIDERATDDVWHRIMQRYGVTLADVGSGRLVDILGKIAARRGTH